MYSAALYTRNGAILAGIILHGVRYWASIKIFPTGRPARGRLVDTGEAPIAALLGRPFQAIARRGAVKNS